MATNSSPVPPTVDVPMSDAAGATLPPVAQSAAAMQGVMPAVNAADRGSDVDPKRVNKRARSASASDTEKRRGSLGREPHDFEVPLSTGIGGTVPTNAISREVYMLTGGQTPASLMPSVPIVSTKSAKPRVRTAWKFTPFSNAARSDGLRLSHWSRVGTADEYPSARFNRKILYVTYTDEEYANVIANNPAVLPAVPTVPQRQTDGRSSPRLVEMSASRQPRAPGTSPRTPTPPLPPNASSLTTFNTTVPTGGSLRHGICQVRAQRPWTKEETDALFSLCAEYDLRFPVIHDRWPDRFSDRSIDELKDRYYSVSKVIIDHRHTRNPQLLMSASAALQKHCQAISMNPFDYEYECIRKNQLEWQYRRSKLELREEEETVREARRIEANRNRMVKERKRLAKLLAPAGELGGAKNTEQALAAAAANLTPQKTFPHRKVSTGPFTRSSLVFTSVSQSAKVCKRVDAALTELGIDLRPMPTGTVVDNFDLLRMDILNFLELQRTVAKKEEEVHTLRVKLAKAKGEPAPSAPPGVPSSHKKRRNDDVEVGSIFGSSGGGAGGISKRGTQNNLKM